MFSDLQLLNGLRENPLRDDAPFVVLAKAGGAKFYLYTLLTTMGAGSVTAKIREIDDSAEVEASAVVVNVLSMFTDQIVNDRGVCFKFGTKYYAFQAPCGGSTAPPPGGGGPGVVPVYPTVISF